MFKAALTTLLFQVSFYLADFDKLSLCCYLKIQTLIKKSNKEGDIKVSNFKQKYNNLLNLLIIDSP